MSPFDQKNRSNFKKKQLEISFSTTTKSLLTLMFGVLFNLLAVVRTRDFCIHPQAMLSRATLPYPWMTKDYGHILRNGPNTDFHPGVILLNAAVTVLLRKHIRLAVNNGARRKASEYIPLTTGKLNFVNVLLTFGLKFLLHIYIYTNSHLLCPPRGRNARKSAIFNHRDGICRKCICLRVKSAES